jgi:hypothetical protein
MDLNEIELEDLSKSFEYVKICMELDCIKDIEKLRDISKLYVKLYIKQQEVLSNMF